MTEPENIPHAKWVRLTSYLDALPLGAMLKLFAALEAERLRPSEDSLPYDAMLRVLREAVAEAGASFPPRPLNAKRLFFRPIEDFLTPIRSGPKRRGRIPRSSLDPIWRLLKSNDIRLVTRKTTQAQQEQTVSPGAKLDPIALSENDVAINQFVKEFKRSAVDFRVAEKSFQSALEDGAPEATLTEKRTLLFAVGRARIKTLLQIASHDQHARRALVGYLGGGKEGLAVLEDLLEIGTLFSIAPEIEALQARFPKPIADLTETDLFDIRNIYRDAVAVAPEAAAGVLLSLVGRLSAPWRAIRLYLHLKSAEDQQLTEIDRDADSLLALLFDDLEVLARALERDATDGFDGQGAWVRLQYFSEYADGIIKEARLVRETVIINRAEASREIAAAACERTTEQAAFKVRALLPTKGSAGSSRLTTRRPQITEISSATYGDAIAAATFLSKVEALQSRLKVSDMIAHKVEVIRKELHRYAHDLIVEIRAAEGDRRRCAKRHMERVIKVGEQLLSPADIKSLTEKMVDASVSA
ncbi:MAG: hypothetical protein AAF720_03285 [Pseudomonadota bacterium]